MFDLSSFSEVLKFIRGFDIGKCAVSGEDIVLLLGLTGSGKSTTANYLLGHFYNVDEDGLVVQTNKGIAYPAKVVDSANSVTSYPSCYKQKIYMGSLALCDCPGLGDTRSLETQVGISFCMDFMMQRAKSIKAIVVVIDYPTVDTQRMDILRNLLLALRNIITSSDSSMNSSFGSSIFILYNRIPAPMKVNHVIAKLKKLLTTEKQRLAQAVASNDELAIETTKKIIAMLDLIVSNPDINLEVDIFDQGESRDIIVRKIASSLSISKWKLSFKYAEESRIEFNRFLSRELGKISDYEKKIGKIKTLVREFKRGISDYQEMQAQIQNHKQELVNCRKQIDSFRGLPNKKEVLDKLHQEAAGYNGKVKELIEKQKDNLNSQISLRTSTDQIEFDPINPTNEKKSICGDVTYYMYEGVPLCDLKIVGVKPGMKMEFLHLDLSNGKFILLCKRSWCGLNGKYPEVKAWVECRHHPISKILIEVLQKEEKELGLAVNVAVRKSDVALMKIRLETALIKQEQRKFQIAVEGVANRQIAIGAAETKMKQLSSENAANKIFLSDEISKIMEQVKLSIDIMDKVKFLFDNDFLSSALNTSYGDFQARIVRISSCLDEIYKTYVNKTVDCKIVNSRSSLFNNTSNTSDMKHAYGR